MTLLSDRIAAAKKAAQTKRRMIEARQKPPPPRPVAEEPKLQPKAGFNWSRVNWGRPDSEPAVLCSYCSASIPDDAIPLICWRDDGHAARFCDRCQKEWWGLG